jgi:hypothetical protein
VSGKETAIAVWNFIFFACIAEVHLFLSIDSRHSFGRLLAIP